MRLMTNIVIAITLVCVFGMFVVAAQGQELPTYSFVSLQVEQAKVLPAQVAPVLRDVQYEWVSDSIITAPLSVEQLDELHGYADVRSTGATFSAVLPFHALLPAVQR